MIVYSTADFCKQEEKKRRKNAKNQHLLCDKYAYVHTLESLDNNKKQFWLNTTADPIQKKRESDIGCLREVGKKKQWTIHYKAYLLKKDIGSAQGSILSVSGRRKWRFNCRRRWYIYVYGVLQQLCIVHTRAILPLPTPTQISHSSCRSIPSNLFFTCRLSTYLSFIDNRWKPTFPSPSPSPLFFIFLPYSFLPSA